jgi:hypothetical protein
MITKTYIARTYLFKVIGVLLTALGLLLFLFGSHISWLKSFLAIFSFSLAYLFWKIPSPKIEVDDAGIGRFHRGKSRLLARIVQPDNKFKRNSIDSVSTVRFNGGTFLTVLYTSEEAPDKPKHSVTIESSLFKDYVSILQTIRDSAAQARFDETTELIIKGQLDIRSVKPIYLGLFVFAVVSAFLCILISKKG